MSKPSWDDAPEWAQWLAQDGHPDEHTYVWFEMKPICDDVDAWLQSGGKWQVTDMGELNPNWRDTLEHRP